MKRQAKINKGLRLLDNSYNIKKNVVKINVGNTLFHELAKCKLVYEFVKQGKEVYTECIFKERGRADVFIPEDLRVIEVLHSEKEEEALKKVDKYPSTLDILFISTKDILKGV